MNMQNCLDKTFNDFNRYMRRWNMLGVTGTDADQLGK